MPPFLLSSQSVLDIAKCQNLPAERWLSARTTGGIYEDDICISAVVPVMVLRQIEIWIAGARKEKSNDLADLNVVLKNAKRYLATFREDRIVCMDCHIAKRWSELLDMELIYTCPSGTFYEVGSSQKVELATASIGRDGHRFTYVDRRQEAHQHVPDLSIECPFEFVEMKKA